MSNSDLVTSITGNFGKWQLRTALIIFLFKIPAAWFMAVILYSAPVPNIGEFWCKPPDNILDRGGGGDVINPLTTDPKLWIAASHPVIEKIDFNNQTKYDFCNIYKDTETYASQLNFSFERSQSKNSNIATIPCKKFIFNVEFHSLVTEYGLVCGRRFLLQLSQCFHIFGLLVGGIIVYYLLNDFSPRRIMLFAMILQVIFGCLCGWLKYFELHILFRCLTAMTVPMMLTPGVMILSDITGGKAKTIIIILNELFWSVGLILLPGITMFFQSWSTLYLVISLPTIILIMLQRLIPDSPRWMIRHGQLERAKMILIKSARTNERLLPLNLDLLLEQERYKYDQQPMQTSWSKLWSGNKPNRRYLIAIHYTWGVFILLFNSMVLNIRAYGQQYVYINNVAIGLSEITGLFIGLYLNLYSSRKWFCVGLMSITTGLLANIAWTIPSTLRETHIVALSMIPCIAMKMSTSATMTVLLTSTSDLVELSKKRLLMFSTSTWARSWFLWAPFVAMTAQYGSLVPLTVFSCLALIGGSLILFIDHYWQNEKKLTKIKNLEIVLEKEKMLGEKGT